MDEYFEQFVNRVSDKINSAQACKFKVISKSSSLILSAKAFSSENQSRDVIRLEKLEASTSHEMHAKN